MDPSSQPSAAQARVGQQAAQKKRELKRVWTKPVQDTKRQGTIFIQNFTSWDVQMRPLWFYFLDFRKKFNLVTSEFPISTTASMLNSLFFCWRTKNRKWFVFFFFLFHTAVMILTEAGRELDNESCRCGISFLNPLCCCLMSGRQWRYSSAIAGDAVRLKQNKHFSLIEIPRWSFPATAQPRLCRAVSQA